MMPASPPPAPNPFRGNRPVAPSPVPVLWLGTRAANPFAPSLGKTWMH